MATKLLTRLLLFSFISGIAQNTKPQNVELVDVIVWDAEAKSGGKFIGISNDQFDAENAIDELRFIKEGTKYQIMNHNIKMKPILIDKSSSVKEDFKSEDDYLEFKYISEIELIALEYMEANDIETAISFYKNVTRQKNPEIIKKHLITLQSNYSKYLFERETGAALVTYME